METLKRYMFGASVAVTFVPLFGVAAVLIVTAKKLRWPL